MKIGLDLHGVISDQPEFFKQLMRSLRNQSWEVHIITGGSIEKVEQEHQLKSTSNQSKSSNQNVYILQVVKQWEVGVGVITSW